MDELDDLFNNLSIDDNKYNRINLFICPNSKKCMNDANNKIRESIIVDITNNNIPLNYYNESNSLLNKYWLLIKNELNYYYSKLLKNDIYYKKELILKAGRRYNTDFELILYNKNNDIINKYNIEFKYNAKLINELPQFVSPGKPSLFLTSSYEEYYYDNYMNELIKKTSLIKPNRDEYIKSINSTNPKCVIEFKKLYKNNNIFKKHANNLAKNSIKEFILNNNILVDKLNKYLLETQKNKYFMLYKNNKFNIEVFNTNDILINPNTCIKTHNSYLFLTNNKKVLKILLRWKNNNGIAFPALQISIMKTNKIYNKLLSTIKSI
jgi:hypothetical protein